MASIGFGSTVFLALVLTHWSCAEERAPCLHLVAERVDISTGGALIVDIDGGGAANSFFLILLRRLVQRSSSAAAVEAAMAIRCAILRVVATFARGWPAAAGSRGCAANRQSLLRRRLRHRHHIGCVQAARSPSTATRPAHLLAAVACARRSAGHVSRGLRSRVRWIASMARSSTAVGRRIR